MLSKTRYPMRKYIHRAARCLHTVALGCCHSYSSVGRCFVVWIRALIHTVP
ncbi:hypothetical protein HETIRDRAFT_164849 [Heterobasidion irregulare TC 32-1]|uniref:Uncharacterized protein n=1 Tax=Heterobasidion irregulare (strain TC 32-1) TaxID=747525 RepID=W4JPZ4_HETIT|nr:uncharacterized protein HETIRDRAFT_164849 [Heterobasidion irregulare TC 32-1]ETW74946.1 hypothetical protein HETIRDRAFT_164849 [Heterobasidion irregulare TC 32-1]